MSENMLEGLLRRGRDSNKAFAPNSENLTFDRSKYLTHTNRIYALAIAASLAFLVFGLIFLRSATNICRAETIGYIRDALQQTKFVVEEHIREELDTLTAVAAIARGRPLLEEDAVLHALMDGLGTHTDFIRIGFADEAGQAIWIDRYDREYYADLSDEEFIQRALLGKSSISHLRYDEAAGETYNTIPYQSIMGKLLLSKGSCLPPFRKASCEAISTIRSMPVRDWRTSSTDRATIS